MTDDRRGDTLRAKAMALDLIRAIDRAADVAADEQELATTVVSMLADAVEAELCLLCLRDDDSGEQQLRELAERAAALPAPQTLPTRLLLHGRQHGHCLAAPLQIGGESLGAMLLLNAERPFDHAERLLVESALTQVDSAMRHQRTQRELRRRQRELETIYRIDRVRDRTPEFQALLDAVLAEVVSALAAETGFLMLFDRSGNELELKATTTQDLFEAEAPAHLIRSVSDEAVHTGELVSRAYADGAVRAVVGVPLILQQKLIGVLGVVNRHDRRGAFTAADLQMLRAIASQMDTAIFESLQTQRLRTAFGQCVGPQVMERLLTVEDRDVLGSERRAVTTLFSDIRGFTPMSETIAPELLQAVLNDHLSALSDLVLAYEGTLDKYIGDCVMCFFNAPEDQPDHALRAVRLALDMQKAHHAVMARWSDHVALPPIGIGISTGETMMGNFGSVRRLEYTAIGRDVNLAARLCAAAEGDQTLISASTYALVADVVVADELPPTHLKGIEGGVRPWNVRGLK
jgi:adenylate cyclase